jgi:hypothetical protein
MPPDRLGQGVVVESEWRHGLLDCVSTMWLGTVCPARRKQASNDLRPSCTVARPRRQGTKEIPRRVHRDARGWSRPDEFVVERWLPGWTEDLGAEYRVYLPFGLGARSCPGASYATRVLTAFLNIVIARRVVSRPSGVRLEVAEGSIRTVHGRLNLHFAERTGA